MPPPANPSQENFSSASIPDGLLKKIVVYTSHGWPACKLQVSGEIASPNGGLHPSQQHITLHHKSLPTAEDGKVLLLPGLLNPVPCYCTQLDCVILFTGSSFILTVVCGFTPTIPIKSLTSYDYPVTWSNLNNETIQVNCKTIHQLICVDELG